MRILHLGKYYAPFHGGIETVTRQVLEALARAGHDAEALVHHHRPMRRETTVIRGVRVTRAAVLGRVLFTPLAPGYPLALCQALARAPDVLHLHLPNPSVFWCLLLPAARRCPWVVHWHADVVNEDASLLLRWMYRLYRIPERALLRRARVIVTTSPAYAHHSPALSDHLDRVESIPLSVEDDLPEHDLTSPEGGRTQATSPFAPAPDEALKVLTVGRLTGYKGHDVALRALEEVRRQRIAVYWVMVGEGARLEALRARVRELGLAGMVSLPGRLSSRAMAEAMADCDVFCLPSISRAEAFGVVLLEAMRSGKPCIATRVPGSGMGFVLEDGVSGRLVEPGDTYSLARALMDAARHPEQWTVLGQAGRQRFLETFAAPRVMTRWLTLYATLTNSAGRP